MTAFLAVLVPEADPVIGRLRERWDPSSQRGLGAHITIRYPFLPHAALALGDLEQLTEAVASVPVFRYHLARVSRFPSTIFLDPEPVAPFATLRDAVERVFGPRLPVDSFPRYVPHLSVARNVQRDGLDVLVALDAAMRAGVVTATCRDVVLLELAGGAPWQVQRTFQLGS